MQVPHGSHLPTSPAPRKGLCCEKSTVATQRLFENADLIYYAFLALLSARQFSMVVLHTSFVKSRLIDFAGPKFCANARRFILLYFSLDGRKYLSGCMILLRNVKEKYFNGYQFLGIRGSLTISEQDSIG